MVEGEALADPPVVPPVPFPVSVMVCGLPVAESVKLSVAARAPAVVGAKTTLTVQLAEAARLAPQVLLKIAKSPGLAPVKAMLPIVIDDVPLLARVTTFCAPRPPTATETQLRVAGETVAAARRWMDGSNNRLNAHRAAKALHCLDWLHAAKTVVGIA